MFILLKASMFFSFLSPAILSSKGHFCKAGSHSLQLLLCPFLANLEALWSLRMGLDSAQSTVKSTLLTQHA